MAEEIEKAAKAMAQDVQNLSDDKLDEVSGGYRRLPTKPKPSMGTTSPKPNVLRL